MAGATLRTGGGAFGAYAQENAAADENSLLENSPPEDELPQFDERLLAQLRKHPFVHSRGKPEETKKQLSFELPYHLEIMIYPAALGLLCLLWCYVIAWTHKDAPGPAVSPQLPGRPVNSNYYYSSGATQAATTDCRLRTTVFR